MASKTRLFIASTTLVFAVTPLNSQSQSLGDLLKLVSNGNSANELISAFKSISEATLGRIEDGAAPENADGKVILYKTATCPHCKRAIAYMRNQSVPFVARDIEKDASSRAEFARLKGPGVPFIVFGEKTMAGFDEAKFERNYAEFKAAKASQGATASGAPPINSAGIQSGDVLLGKIPGVVVYSRPEKSEKIAVLAKNDEVIFMGDESGGFYRVTTPKGEGWIDKLLVKKQ
jgi:glutaredoxin